MKNKKIVFIIIVAILVILISLGVAYHYRNRKAYELDLPEKEQTLKVITEENGENSYSKDFGSYNILDGWVESKEHSTNNKFFYVKRGQEQDERPNNISVNAGKNKYRENEHEKFRTAILNQLSMQIGNSKDVTVNADGSNTENGYILYTFTIQDTNSETIQYYIVGDYKYVLVHETVYNSDEKNETNDVAKEIINSFKWKE